MPIETYMNMVDEKTQMQVSPIILHIENAHKNAVLDEKYSERTLIPTWRIGEKYVAVACRKHYISVYFSSGEAPATVKENTNSPYVLARKGCINICYRCKNIPYEAIYKGIDICFK